VHAIKPIIRYKPVQCSSVREFVFASLFLGLYQSYFERSEIHYILVAECECIVECCGLQFTDRRSHWPLEVTADASMANSSAPNLPTPLRRREVFSHTAE